jgi:FtsP/CotA-like multicopper oxidase with cupredoxin domain
MVPGSQSETMIGRRHLLKLTAGAGVAAFGMTSGGLLLPRINTVRAAEGGELIESEVRESKDGLLDTTLEATVMPVQVAGGTAIMSVFDGTVPGPTLRVRPGDTLRIKLVNKLGDLPKGLPADSPFNWVPMGEDGMMTSDTNLHMHGFHVSPSGNSDNIFINVMAGDSFQYEYQIPSNHPSGTYHYHPHMHGASHQQVFGGMVGAIVIEGDIDHLPGIEGLTERMLVLQATQFTPDGGSVIAQEDGSQKNYLRLVNGQLNPTITIKPGETQRWRVQNLSPSSTFRLHLDGHQLHQIAKDGNTMDELWTQDTIIMGPGERVEVLVQAGDAGSYALRTLPNATGFTTQAGQVLATMVSAGAASTPEPLPTTLIPFEDLSALSADEIDGHRQITFQIKPPINPRAITAQIDSKIFDVNRDDQVVRLNTTEEWVIRNASTQWHPFHIHINDYQVIAINGQPVRVRSGEDTTRVPPFGEITMRTRYRDFPGRWVYHCHILLHEDQGMMGTVQCDA